MLISLVQNSHATKLNVRKLRLLISLKLLRRILLSSEREVCVVEGTLECYCWVQESQTTRSKNDHQTLQNHEQCFITCKERGVESTGKFGNTIRASNENRNGSRHESNQERLEQSGVDDVEICRVPRSLSFVDAEEELSTANGEQTEGKDCWS
jgi:hypothetical protein